MAQSAIAQNGHCDAILTKGSITLSGGMTVDSFNSQDTNSSTAGRYDPSKRTDGGNIASDSNLQPAISTVITSSGGADVYGHAGTGPTGNISTSGNSSIGSLAWVNGGNRGIQPGWLTNNVDISIPDAQLPGVTFLPLPQNSGKVNGTNYTYVITNGNYQISSLSLSSSQNICVSGNVVLYFPAGFQMSGHAYIYIASGAKLTIYLGGNCTLSGGGVVNGTGFATSCAFFGLPSCTSIQNSGSSEFIGTIYAPEAAFNMSGGGSSAINFVGAVVASSVSISGHYQFHYDESLCITCNAPEITTLPADQSVCSGSPAAFSVGATGTGLNYQWLFNSVPLGGQTNTSLAIPSATSSNAGTYSVIVNGTCGAVTNSANLTVNTPTTANGPASAVKNPGDNITFSTTASGTGPFTYIWRLNGALLSGQTNNTFSILSVSSTNAGTYSVEVYGNCNGVTNNASLAVNTPTSATISVSSLTLCPGNTGTLSTIASGTGPFTYVWSKNGGVLPGQTTNSLTLPAVTAADAGVYTVVVTGAANSVTNSASVMVNTATSVSALTPVTVCPGNSATFSTVALGTGPFSYEWMKDGVVLSGQTTNKLTIANAGSADAGQYSVNVSGPCNSAVSSAALTVNSVTTATPMTNLVLNPGSTASFSTVASGTGPFTYVWRFNGAQLSGQTTNAITISSVGSTNAGTYSVEVYGNCNNVTNTATLNVNTPTSATNPSGSLAVCPGDGASFSTAAAGTGPFSYMWMKNGVPLAGQTSNSIVLFSVAATDAGLYSVVVTGAANSVTNSATLIVNTPTTVSALTPVTVCPGGGAIFNAAASGTGPFGYVWMKNGVVLPGQTSNTLAITNAGPADAGLYGVSVSGTCNSANSSATLTVNTPVTASGPTSMASNPGGNVIFSTTASGTGPFTYTWHHDGVLLAAQIANTLALNSVSLTNAGIYTVIVSGNCNSVTNSATLTVNSNTSATFSSGNQALCPGNSATLAVVASGTGPFTYAWSLNGVVLAGQTSSNLNLNAVTSADAGVYNVVVTGAANSVTNSATLTVNTNTSATALTSLTVCPGNPATFTTTPSGTGPFAYVWRFNGTQLPGQTTNTFSISSVSSINAGTYSVEVYGGCNSVTNSATLTVSTNLLATPLSNLALCPGNPATFATVASGSGPFSYVWRFNGVQLIGQSTGTLNIPSAASTNAGTYSVEVYGSCNSVTNTAALTVNTNTTATPLTSLTLCSGSPAAFTTSASGTGPFTYVWRLNGVQLVGQATNSLTIASVTSTDAGNYSVEVYGSCNSVTNVATLSVNTFTTATPLTSQALCSGSPATFLTTASGTGPFSYVWRLNGVQLSGQATNVLIIPSVAATNAGTYSVEVYGSCNSVTNTAVLTVNTNTSATALASQTLCPGSPASFATMASGTGPFGYIWRFNGAQLSGQATNVLIIPSVAPTNAGTYTVEVYGSCNSVTNTATLTVNTNTTATPLSSLALCPGSPATFTTTASGTGPFSYIWRLNGIQLSGQTTNSLNIPSVTATNAGTYTVEVYGSCSSVTNTATLVVNVPTMTTALTSQTLCPGSPATFSTTSSGTGPFSYVWRFNGSQLAGQTSNSFIIPSVASTNAGTYTVEVYCSCNSVTNSATLMVNTNTTATALTSLTVCPGNPATFTTSASGTGPFTYVWRLNGAQLIDQTMHSISISSAGATNAGTYCVEVYGNCNSVTNSAMLTVSTNLMATPLSNLALCPGSPATFATIASGSGPFAYVWRFKGTQLIGQTTNSLTILSVAPTNAGTYTVEVYGSCSSVTNSATLTLNTNTTATALSSQTLCPGSPVTFTTTASGTGPFTYVWRLNGSQLTGQTTGNLTIPSVTSTNAGTYSVEVYGSCNSVTNSATLTVNSSTAATPLASLVRNAGTSAMFSTVASGTGPFTYVWRLNGKLLAGQTSSSLSIGSVASTNTGNYSVEVYGNCNSVTNSATLTLTVPPTVTILSPTNGATFIALANITILAQVQDLDSTVTNVEFFAATNAPGITNVPSVAKLFAQTNKLGQTMSGPPYFILWTNVTPGIYYLGARGTDALGAVGLSQIIAISVLDQLPVTSTGPMQFNPQTDVFEQPVRVTNPTYYTYNGVRLLIGNLAPGVQVYNATGTTNGLPFVQSILPIPPGGTVDFTIEYYVLSRVAPNPVFTVQLVAPLNAVNQVGPTQHINRGLLLPNKSFLVEFNTMSNRVYYLQYSADLVHWNTANHAIAGIGNVIDWIDNGAPETAAHPSTQTKRFYRLILLP